MENCQSCGRRAPVKYVALYQNIGMLLIRQLRCVKGNLCKRCVKHHFWRLTGLTLVTGWWGLISFIINPFIIINNIVRMLMCAGMADEGEQV